MNTLIRFIGMLITGLVTAALLAGCANTPDVPPPPEVDKVVDEYQIGVGDSLRINVWRNEELSVDVPVRPDGKISLALVGDEQAAGLTTSALSARLEEALAEYVRNPQVTVIVSNPSSADFQRRVRVTGAVQSPQSIPYREGMTVLDLVLMAGGLNEFAAPNRAKLYRKVNGKVKAYPIYLDDLINKGKVDTNYPLAPSDIVTVPERAF